MFPVLLLITSQLGNRLVITMLVGIMGDDDSEVIMRKPQCEDGENK